MSEKTGKERRKHDRKEVTGVQGSFLYGADVKLVDLSLSGVALETDRYLPLGRRYSLKLGKDDQPVDITGRVAWSRLVRTEADPKGEVKPVYRVGLRLENALSPQGDAILQFLLDHTPAGTGERVFGRFRPEAGDSAEVSRRSPFEVTKLSAGGMQIETVSGPGIGETLELELWLGGKETVEVTGRVVSIPSGEDSSGDQVSLGLEFVDLPDNIRATIDAFVSADEDDDQ